MNDTKKQLDKPNGTEENGNPAGPQFDYTKQMSRNDGCNLKSYSQRLGDEPDTNAEQKQPPLVAIIHIHTARTDAVPLPP